MEITKAIQGGQNSFDNSNQRVELIAPPKVETVQKLQNAENASSGDKDNKDPVNEKELKKALDKLSGFIEDTNTSVEYKYHNTFKNDLMITIVDKTNNNVILEVPPKKILDLVAKMMEMVGVLFDKKA